MDDSFQLAVQAIDAGDEQELQNLLVQHPQLSTERLTHAGTWLSDKIKKPLEGFFKDPYLLWFVAEDPIRNDTLPSNIHRIAALIIKHLKEQHSPKEKEILDYALMLVAWSVVAPRCGVQLRLIDVLVEAGASPRGTANNAMVNGNMEAAAHLLKRGDEWSLASALCLENWPEAERLVPLATTRDKQFSLTLCALNGKPKAVARLLQMKDLHINLPSQDLYSHASPLHHAVYSGSLETVKLLVEAGASLTSIDSVWDGTPLGWAEYGGWKEIEEYLKGKLKKDQDLTSGTSG